MPRPSLARTRARAKAALGPWPAAKSVAYIADDLGWGVRQRLGRIQSDSGSTHLAVPLDRSVDYLEGVFSDYTTYGGLDRLRGSAAEVGPGDNAGVALLLRQAGCESVELIDRFRSRRSPAQQRQIYEALAQQCGLERPAGAQDWDDEHLPGITWRVGLSAEAYFAGCARAGGRRYDLIVSRAALEHLYDPLGALRDMALCLRPGGRMVHKIDFRDHGMFTPTHPELTFLRFPRPVYRQMTRRSGRPNRVLLHRYRSLATELGRIAALDVTLLVTSLVGEGELSPHVPLAQIPADRLRQALTRVDAQRHRFAREFAGVSSVDLAVSGIFWVGTRRVR
ncbi:MAG TPA: class I SAM-dependent methyltransferase [Streptosporangiaceae bacterium]|nr:class I SAM-dependent methyltransferase [Streptosporangiaceae bacterium]